MTKETLDATDYKNGPKNNWRRTMWNRLRAMTRTPHEDLVLYLPGATNLDLPVAQERGYDKRNMIAIERNRRVAKHIRKTFGQTAIDADLSDVVQSWPATRPVKIVIADLVHGLTTPTLNLMRWWMMNPAFCRGHLVLNMMRGRETDNPILKVASIGKVKEVLDACVSQAEEFNGPTSTKSRAVQGILAANLVMAQILVSRFQEPERGVLLGKAFEVLLNTPHEEKFHVASLLPSYRSPSGQTFDSFMLMDLDRWSRDGNPRKPFPDFLRGDSPEDIKKIDALKLVNRRIVAAMAVRTMRMNGDLEVH
jgi:hypothetical protein